MTGKVISLGQVIVDLTMNVDAVPRAGEDVFAGNVQNAGWCQLQYAVCRAPHGR